jgi:hypothetical protein
MRSDHSLRLLHLCILICNPLNLMIFQLLSNRSLRIEGLLAVLYVLLLYRLQCIVNSIRTNIIRIINTLFR